MRRYYVTLLLLGTDLVGAFLTFLLAHTIRYGASAFPFGWVSFYSMIYGPLLAVGLWMLLILLFGSHGSPSGLNYPLDFSQLTTPYFFFTVAFLAIFFADHVLYSRLELAIFFLLFYIFLLFSRIFLRRALLWLRRYRIGLRRVVIVGDSELAQDLARRIDGHPELHYEVAGYLTPASGMGARGASNRLVAGNSEAMAQELASRNVHELIFVIPIRKDSETLDFIANCQKHGLSVKLVPEYYEMHSQQIESLSIDGIPLLELKSLYPDPAFRMLKRLMDVTAAGILMILLSPVALLIGLILWVSDHQRVLRSELRIGLEGRPFRMLRFHVDSSSRAPKGPADWGERFRRFLYRYSFSEMPQFWNVLKGDMSLVGPRPESPERVRHYSTWHQRRLLLKPGMTGLAQVRGLRGTDSSDEKTRYDLEYAANQSPFLDVRLLFATLGTLARRGRTKALPPKSPRGLPLSGRWNEKRA